MVLILDVHACKEQKQQNQRKRNRDLLGQFQRRRQRRGSLCVKTWKMSRSLTCVQKGEKIQDKGITLYKKRYERMCLV